MCHVAVVERLPGHQYSDVTDPFWLLSSDIWKQNAAYAGVMGPKGCCIFQYHSWTDSIKPRQLFANFIGSNYFRMIPFLDYLEITTQQLSRCHMAVVEHLPVYRQSAVTIRFRHPKAEYCLWGVTDFAFCSSFHKRTQSNRVCCFPIVFRLAVYPNDPLLRVFVNLGLEYDLFRLRRITRSMLMIKLKWIRNSIL